MTKQDRLREIKERPYEPTKRRININVDDFNFLVQQLETEIKVNKIARDALNKLKFHPAGAGHLSIECLVQMDALEKEMK